MREGRRCVCVCVCVCVYVFEFEFECECVCPVFLEFLLKEIKK